MKSLLTVKHGKLHPELVKGRHRKFLRNCIEGSRVKEFCHKIERKSLNIITTYFNNRAESQEVVNNDHHPIILTNDTSEISLSIKDVRVKGPSFVRTPISYDLAQLQLDFDTFASIMRARYMEGGNGGWGGGGGGCVALDYNQ